MSANPLLPDLGAVGWIVVDAVLALLAVVLVVRVVGLRSFAKMSSFDFAVTVACGSVLASVLVDRDLSFVHGLLAVGALLLTQWAIAKGRREFGLVSQLVDNTPLLLVRDGRIIEPNMAKGRITEADLRAKLREANVLEMSRVRAVVLETTGDVSVLHGEASLDETLLEGVRR